jgi:hypothetical protein
MPSSAQRHEGSLKRGLITALTAGPINIFATQGTGLALVAGGIAAVVQVLGEVAAAADGRKKVVAAGFADMHPAEVEEWLQRDIRNLTLAVQSVIQATATFDEHKIGALGRAFRAGVTDSARVDESLLVVRALGALERPHIDVLHVIARKKPPLWTEQHDQTNESEMDAARSAWFIAGLTKRLPHLREVMSALELTLRTSGITWRSEGYGGPDNDVHLMPLGQLCVDYLAAEPPSTADAGD